MISNMSVASGAAILVYAGICTEVGKARPRNEDAVHQAQLPMGYFVALADPVGDDGEHAGTMAVSAIAAEVEREQTDPAQALRSGFDKANQALREAAASRGVSMGATCVAAIISGSELHVAHVGDARVYLLRGASLYALTRDHSLMQEIADLKGPVAATEFAPALRFIMSRTIGAEETVNVAQRPPITLRAGDVILLCTDGLTSSVSDVRIRRVLAGSTPREAARRLVEIASEQAGEDNTTVVVLRVDSDLAGFDRTMTFDGLTSMFVRTANGDLHPVVDAILSPATWSVSSIRVDLRNAQRGAVCELPISEIGPLSPGQQIIQTPRCTEALLNIAVMTDQSE